MEDDHGGAAAAAAAPAARDVERGVVDLTPRPPFAGQETVTADTPTAASPTPVPLWKARGVLLEAVSRGERFLSDRAWRGPGGGSEGDTEGPGCGGEVCSVRLEVLVDAEELGDGQGAPLAWFEAQPVSRPQPLEDPTLPRVFLRTPSGGDGRREKEGGGVARDSEVGVAAAGIGAAHVLTGPGRLEDGSWMEALSVCPRMRYYGGARFEPLSRTQTAPPPPSTTIPKSSGTKTPRGGDRREKGVVLPPGDAAEPAPQWRAYGGHWFVLPLVELSTAGGDQLERYNGDEPAQATTPTITTTTVTTSAAVSSSAATIRTRSTPTKTKPTALTLAVNLRWSVPPAQTTTTTPTAAIAPTSQRATRTRTGTRNRSRNRDRTSAAADATPNGTNFAAFSSGESRTVSGFDDEQPGSANQAIAAAAAMVEGLTLEQACARAVRVLERVACRYVRPGTEGELPLPIAAGGRGSGGGGGDPVMDTDGEEYRRWARGIERALDDMENERYSKVVLARTAKLQFPVPLAPADILARFREHYGFLFCLQPNANTAFVGCTPERLFLSRGSTIVTEALAGTRPRGSTPGEDQRLGAELMASAKDMSENVITADYVSAALRRAGAEGLHCSEACLKRLTHVQHICRRITATLGTAGESPDATKVTPTTTAAAAAVAPNHVSGNIPDSATTLPGVTAGARTAVAVAGAVLGAELPVSCVVDHRAASTGGGLSVSRGGVSRAGLEDAPLSSPLSRSVLPSPSSSPSSPPPPLPSTLLPSPSPPSSSSSRPLPPPSSSSLSPPSLASSSSSSQSSPPSSPNPQPLKREEITTSPPIAGNPERGVFAGGTSSSSSGKEVLPPLRDVLGYDDDEVSAGAVDDVRDFEGVLGMEEGGATGMSLLREMHPTPAVCGKPRDVTYRVIGEVEGFDRGFYAGPVGYISGGASDFGVAIRSALVANTKGGGSEMTLFAGAGIVPGSEARSEWAETGVKMKNFLSLFPEKPARALRSLPNVNSLWGALIVEELVRLGVRHFCVCPGSRSAPLVVAIARHPSAVVISHHDERGAGFYAVGFARAGLAAGLAAGLCAVVTSSGTAVANLLPAAAEADAAGLPMLLLTADRPAELRGCGSSQTIDQVKLVGSRARLSVDVQCPTDEVDAASVLSNIDHAVCRALGGGGLRSSAPGPVHLNLMFRENLAPVDGAVRDAGVLGLSSHWSDRCLDSPRIAQWEAGVKPFTKNIGGDFGRVERGSGLEKVAESLLSAKRGLLVMGSLRGPAERAAARHLALTLRWPVYADVTSGLRCWCGEVGLGVGRLDQMLIDDAVRGSIAPDAILQVSSPLISKRIQKFVCSRSTTLTARISVICTPRDDWYDPGRAFTTRLACSVGELSEAVDLAARDLDMGSNPGFISRPGSELLRLIPVSDAVEGAQTASICTALASEEPQARKPDSKAVPTGPSSTTAATGSNVAAGSQIPTAGSDSEAPNACSSGRDIRAGGDGGGGRVGAGAALTEPFVAWCASRHIRPSAGLFLSSSMPCRDVDSFADTGLSLSGGVAPRPRPCTPKDSGGDGDDGDGRSGDHGGTGETWLPHSSPAGPMHGSWTGQGGGDGGDGGRRLSNVSSNRGACGIDGVVSSAMGFAAGLRAPVTLLIGDMATLHDLSSFHALRGVDAACCPVTVVCVNNGGGGIFSFLPIAEPRHADVFSPLFDTPHAVDFEGVCLSMGLVYRRASTAREFQQAFLESQEVSIGGGQHFFIEAVTAREENVSIHRSLGRLGCSTAIKRALRDVRLGWEFTPAPLAESHTSAARDSAGNAGPTERGSKEDHDRVSRDKKNPTLLLLHGFMGSKMDWRGEFAELASKDGYAILTVELPGHGGSSGGGDEGNGNSPPEVVHPQRPPRQEDGSRSPPVTSSGPSSTATTDQSQTGRRAASEAPGPSSADVGGTGHPLCPPLNIPASPRSSVAKFYCDQETHSASGLASNTIGGTIPRRERGGHEDGVPWGLGGVELAAEAVAAVCDAVAAGPYLVVGYSMGGRVALALAGRKPGLLEGGGGLVLVSASPGLTSTTERVSRWKSDGALASRIASFDRLSLAPSTASSTAPPPVKKNAFHGAAKPFPSPLTTTAVASDVIEEAPARLFLERWYAAPLWGDMRRRRPLLYSAMENLRLSFGFRRATPPRSSGLELAVRSGVRSGLPGGRSRAGGADLARCCLALCVARQPDMWPLLRRISESSAGIPVAYVAGELDYRYGRSTPLPTAAASATSEDVPSAAQVATDAGTGDSNAGQGGGTGTHPPSRVVPDGAGVRDALEVRAGGLAPAGVANARAIRAHGLPPHAPPMAVAETIAAAYPQVRVALLPGCGHAVPTEAAGALYREVVEIAALAPPAAVVGTAAVLMPDVRSTEKVGDVGVPVSSVTTGFMAGGGDEAREANAISAVTAKSIEGDTHALGRGQGRAAAGEEGDGGITITGFSVEEFSVPVSPPLQLSLCRLIERRGVLVRLQGIRPSCAAGVKRGRGASDRSGENGSIFSGVGEVTPLPGFHRESLEEATAQLQAVLPLLVGRAATFGLAALDESLDAWLSEALALDSGPALGRSGSGGGGRKGNDSTGTGVNGGVVAFDGCEPAAAAVDGSPPPCRLPQGDEDQCDAAARVIDPSTVDDADGEIELLPSVRCGIEMALIHLVARASGVSIGAAVSAASGLPCRGAVEINGLAARGEGSSRREGATPRVLKVKVGGDVGPSADATRALELLGSSPKGSTLRLDANQAWSMGEALLFTSVLSGARSEGTGGASFASNAVGAVEYIEEPLRDPRSLGDFWDRSGKVLPYALDESLAMGREVFTDEQLLGLEGCGAFVVKIAVVGGLGRAARLCRLARRLGATAVFSSAFESGVGLAHASILASCFTDEGVAHGLSTYTRLDGDVSTPGFSGAVSGGTVDVIACQELLDGVAARTG